MEYLDQMGRRVEIPFNPQRIISVVPSQTELLAYLGLESEVIGITKFCIHPERWYQTKERIGGTKNLNLERIAALNPDLIIGNKEENTQSDIEWLSARFPVWMSDIYTLEDSLDMMLKLGEILDRKSEASNLVSLLQADFDALSSKFEQSFAYFIWKDPYMVAASNTFIHNLLERMGLGNVFANFERYPIVTPELLAERAPELILLSSEPYPFGDKHLDYFQKICPSSKVILVDGEVFSWYGSRLLHTKNYIERLVL